MNDRAADGDGRGFYDALERWLRRDKHYRELTRSVREAQRALRNGVGDDGWKLYLALEERMNARHVEVIAAAVRLASLQDKKKKRRRSSRVRGRRPA